MKKHLLGALFAASFLGTAFSQEATLNNPYAAVPPFLKQDTYANLMLVLDYSGSMTDRAYPDDFDPNKTYVGYFDPESRYTDECIEGDRSSEFTKWLWRKDPNGDYTGNYLNWHYMTRIDLLRWILTGGKTVKRKVSNKGIGILEIDYNLSLLSFKRLLYGNYYYKTFCEKYNKNRQNFCNAECYDYTPPFQYMNLYKDRLCFWLCWYPEHFPVEKLSVNCISPQENYKEYIETYLGDLIVGEDSSSYNTKTGQIEGLLQKLERLKVHPRVGAVIFGESGNSVIKKWVYPLPYYGKVIEAINNITPKGATPTGEALDEVRRYFSLKSGKWAGGFSKNDPDYVNPYVFDIDVNGDGKIDNKDAIACARNLILLVSDGAWNGHGDCYAKKKYCSCKEEEGNCIKKPADLKNCKYRCAIDPVIPAYKMWEGGEADLVDDLQGLQNAKTYTVSAFLTEKAIGENALKNIAIYGGFTDLNGNGYPEPYFSVPPNPECNKFHSPKDKNHCGSFVDVLASSPEWDKNGDGLPDNFFSGDTPQKLQHALEKAFTKIIEEVSSGTSVYVMPENKVTSLAIQSVLYPQQTFSFGYQTYSVNWVGHLFTWWLYKNAWTENIREDTNENKQFDLTQDNILEWKYTETSLKIYAYQSKEDGTKGQLSAIYNSFDETHPLIDAGKTLALTTPADRKIYTTVDGKNLIEFTQFNINTIQPYLGKEENLPTCLGLDFGNLVRYIRGEDIEGCRSRVIDSYGDTWKLGDIIYSSPKVVDYGDFKVAFVGANDGMLHAFRIGYVSSEINPQLQNSKYDKETNRLGEELWAFIPKNVLPYLRYLADPKYQHIYTVDLEPYIINIDYNNDGKEEKVLIGGLRLGGAVGCSEDVCVKPPSDVPEGVGLSSYFALDITNPTNPKLLWEFTHKDLGFSFSGPGIVRKGENTYVIFVNGPINYDATVNQNMINNASKYPLKIFVLNLANGELIRTIDVNVGKPAFGGRLFKEGFDADGDGKTDYLFIGYSKAEGSPTQWKGGLIQLDTRSDDPADWVAYIVGGFDFGPITAKVVVEKCFGHPYLFFGTGRWFSKLENYSVNRNRLWALPLNCIGNECVVSQNSQVAAQSGLSKEVTIPKSATKENPVVLYFQNLKIKLWYEKFEKVPGTYEVWFDAETIDGKPVDAVLELRTPNGEKPVWVGANPYHLKLDKNKSQDIEYWRPVKEEETPSILRVVIKNNSDSNICLNTAQTGQRWGWYIELEDSKQEGGVTYLKERVITDPTVFNNIAIFATIEPAGSPCAVGGRSRMWILNCATGSAISQYCQVQTNQGTQEFFKIEEPKETVFVQTSTGAIVPIKLQNIYQSGTKTTNWVAGVAPETATPVAKPYVSNAPLPGEILLWLEY
jgi:type IV pilus assembly protein PilY1